MTGEVDLDADPQIIASGVCLGEDDVEYPVELSGDFTGTDASGTIIFIDEDEGDDTSADWYGDWARDELEGEYEGSMDPFGWWRSITFEGEFELVRDE